MHGALTKADDERLSLAQCHRSNRMLPPRFLHQYISHFHDCESLLYDDDFVVVYEHWHFAVIDR